MLYVTKDYQHVFFINLKCGYSTFEKLYLKGHLLKLNKNYLNNYIYSDIFSKINPDSVTLWTIMRNPRARLCSFFKDKFHACFLEGNTKFRSQWCQKEMYKFFPKEKIENRELTISDFINSLKRGYTDDHIFPQSRLFSFNVFKKDIHILKMEDEDFNRKCQEIIGIEIPKENVTNSNDINLNDEDIEIINNLFADDFKTYQNQIIEFDESKISKNIFFI